MNINLASALERTNMIQKMILRVMAKKRSWWQAAEIVGIAERQMRRCDAR